MTSCGASTWRQARALYNIDKIQFTDMEDRQRYVLESENINVLWCPGISDP